MSESRSIRLSEFFSDDDSEGHRFAEFIKKRRGGTRNKDYLFMDCETDNLSLDVQLQKLPTPQLSKSCDQVEKHIGKENNEVNKTLRQEENEEPMPSESSDLNNFVFCEQLDLPVVPLSTLKDSIEHPSTSCFPSVKSNNSAIRKSGVLCSPSDRLRRLSMKNHISSRLAGGRRTLLQEFENTIVSKEDFNPAICSTPVSQPSKNVIPPISNEQLSSEVENIKNTASSNQSPEIENVDLESANNPITSDTCCGHTDTLIKTLQRKDTELKNYMDSILDKTLKKIENQTKILNEKSVDKTIINRTNNCTTLKRTFTVEKGNVPGQLILMPDEINNENSNKIDCQNVSCVRSPDCSSSKRVCKTHQIKCSSNRSQQEPTLQEIQKGTPKVPNSSQNCNVSIVFPTHNIQETEAISQASNAKQSITIRSDANEYIVDVPFNQTSSGKNHNILNDKSKQVVDSSVDHNKTFQQVEDNLKLTDILTDDEDDPTLQSAKNTSEIPLNLAPNSYNLRKKRLRRRSVKQKLHKGKYQPQSPETECEIQHSSQNKGHLPKRKCKPLNRAPGIPLNGEEYAQELSRMSNYEILDLRKRNSLGQVFIMSGHKSNHNTREKVNKKKLQLDEQIEQEIFKRNLGNISSSSMTKLNQSNIENIMPPAPNEFQDSLADQEASNIPNDIDFIGEKPSDRIKFKDCTLKPKNKKLPEILHQYLEISKKYSKIQKRKSNKINMSKRSLFNTQNLNKSSEHSLSVTTRSEQRPACSTAKEFSVPILKSPETTCSEQRPSCSSSKEFSVPSLKSTETMRSEERPTCSTANEFTAPILKSPPKTTNVLITSIKVVSPPPPLCSSTCEIENNVHNMETDNDIAIPPPPPGFESDTAITTNIHNNQYSTDITAEACEITTTTTCMDTNKNDDDLFKKPTKPAPKRKVKKVSKPSNIQHESADDNQSSFNSTDSSENGSVRRSKRGQVPITESPIIAIFREHFLKKQNSYEKKKREESKKYYNETRTKNKSQSLATVPENDALNSCTSQSTNLKKKEKAMRNKIYENSQCSQLTPNSTPPVDHPNNTFDQLKQSSMSNTIVNSTSSRPKIKPLKICVRNLDFETRTIDSLSSNTDSERSNSDEEFIPWLKNMDAIPNSEQQPLNPEVAVKEMQLSKASNLSFTELKGVEYAFYNNELEPSLGYLRFKPRQVKPKKKAKRNNLHFVVLVGKFRITTENLEHILCVGDMVVVEKLFHYDIENLTDDIGIVMVFKK